MFLKKINYFHIIFFIIAICLSTIPIPCSKISLRAIEVEEGIYNFVLQKRFSILTYFGGLRTAKEKYGFSLLNFKISYSNKTDKKHFYIYHEYNGVYIGVKNESNSNIDTDMLKITVNDTIVKNYENNYCSNYEWEFVKEKGKLNSFIMRNKLGCELCEIRNKFFCCFKEKGTAFSLFKIFQETEKNMTEEDKKILEAEPIDVFIKYIDLSDPKLTRNNLSQIKKDEENEELRYCIRSVLKNIPWIRKIFILMPNEKVRFFKNYSEIKEKIVYVNDKDILGHESANIHAFQFRIWKLRDYGLSENFISMDDDYFIGKPMEKSDFFYVENKTVLPAIINTRFEVQTLTAIEKEIKEREKKLKTNKRKQTSDEFMYMVYRSYHFLIQYFDSPIIIPYFTHNAIPVNNKDLKEVFDLIDNSTEFRYPTLYSLYRHYQSLQYQTMLVVYIFNKYKRKVNKINYNYIDATNTINGNFDYPLFCINTGGDNDYSKISLNKMKVGMEKLFPVPTDYEIYETKPLAENAYYIIKEIDEEIKELTNIKKIEELEKEQFEEKKISRKYEIYKNQLDFLKAENMGYNIKINKINLELEKCHNERYIKEYYLNQLEKDNDKYYLISEMKKEINEINNENTYYEKNINKYKREKEEYLDQLNKMKNDENTIYFFIYIQLLLIIITIIISLFVFCNKNEKEKYIKIENFEYD